MPVLNYWTWTKNTPQKIVFSENLGYDNYPHRNAIVTKFLSNDHIYNIVWVTQSNVFGDVLNKHFDVITLLQKTRVAIFAGAIKTANILLKKIFKDSKKWKGLETMC